MGTWSQDFVDLYRAICDHLDRRGEARNLVSDLHSSRRSRALISFNPSSGRDHNKFDI
jgi:hypothetical protein